jgi:hypothetical protein
LAFVAITIVFAEMGETMAGTIHTRIVFLLSCLVLIPAQGVLLATDGALGPDQLRIAHKSLARRSR